jgi:hypothetical protein
MMQKVLTVMCDDEACFTIRYACKKADVSPSWFYRLQKQHEDFAAAVAEANEQITQRLEQRAGERAYGIGKFKPSDLLMMFLLKGRRPQTYRDNVKLEHAGFVTVKDLLLKG